MVLFSQQGSTEANVATAKEKIYEEVDQEAEFPGGRIEMSKFLAKIIVYPEEAMINNEQGKVFIEFIVNIDGSIEEIKVLRGVSEELNNESMRVIGLMPNWIPAEKDGEKVRSKCRVPINFVLENSNRKSRKEERNKMKK